MKNKQNFVVCPDCKSEIKFNSKTLALGDVLECQNCGTEVEIVSLDPIEIQIIEEEK